MQYFNHKISYKLIIKINIEVNKLTATDSDIASRIFPIAVFEPTPVTTALARPTVTTVPYNFSAVLSAKRALNL